MEKEFAVGEILTAQDVNEYLRNRVTRRILTGLNVAAPSDFGTLSVADAIVDEDNAGNRLVSLRMALTGHPGIEPGTFNHLFGTLAQDLWPNDIHPLDVVSLSVSLSGFIQTNGQLLLRWASGTLGPGANIRIGATYPILA